LYWCFQAYGHTVLLGAKRNFRKPTTRCKRQPVDKEAKGRDREDNGGIAGRGSLGKESNAQLK